MFRLTPVVLNLALINGLVFILQLLIESKAPHLSQYFTLYKSNLLGFRDVIEVNGQPYYVTEDTFRFLEFGVVDHLENFKADNFKPIQLLTHFFSHGGFMHIFFNMLSLIIIGPMVELAIGSRRFLEFYLFSGFVGNIYNLIDPSITPVIGASGAVSGVFLAFAMLYPDQEMMFLFLPFPIKAKNLLIGYVVISVFLLVIGDNSGVSHFGHLAGMAAAFLYNILWIITSRFR